MKANRIIWLYLLIMGIIYYLSFYLFITDTGSGIFFLLGALPGLVIIFSFIFAYKNGLKWYFSLLSGLLWLPNVFLLRDPSFSFYIWMYMLVSLLGQLIGHFFYWIKQKK